MSIFPTKILLATDGSKEAELARTTAVDLATTTGSELHVVTVASGHPPTMATSPTTSGSRKWQSNCVSEQR